MITNRFILGCAVMYLCARYGPQAALSLVDPRYFLDPITMSVDHETLQITSLRRTQASRDFDWLRVSATWSAEARFMSEPFLTCVEPPGEGIFEVIGDPPDDMRLLDVVVYSVPWIEPCLNAHDTIYEGAYNITLTVTDGLLEGYSIRHPRAVHFAELFPAREH